MINGAQKIKEFFNLYGYYLRLHLTNQQLSLISYNSNLLDGIKYESKDNIEEIKKNENVKNLTVDDLYELITSKIKENKFMIKNEQNILKIILYNNIQNNSSKEIEFNLFPNNKEYISEYENVLSNIIINLREENKLLKNEINEIKKFINFNNSNNTKFAEVKLLKSKPQNVNNNINISQSQNLLNNSISNKISNNHKLPAPIKKTISGPMPEQKENLMKNKNMINQAQLNILKNLENLNIESLANIKYQDYPKVELSPKSFGKIIAYGVNSYHGIFKKNNEDRTKVILDSKLNKTINNSYGEPIIPNISFFAIYDGHGGNKCSDFLYDKFHTLLFNSTSFPIYTLQAIYDAFMKSEKEFESLSFDPQRGVMLDKSGSCALSALFINEWCFMSYLGDSRALYSYDSGKQLFQITRDQKPNDIIEKSRIERAGGRIFKDTRLKINGEKIHVNEQACPGIVFPFRVVPGNLSVSIYIIILILYRLLEQLGI